MADEREMVVFDIPVPEPLKEVFEGVALANDGSVRIAWKRNMLVNFHVGDVQLTMMSDIVLKNFSVTASPLDEVVGPIPHGIHALVPGKGGRRE